MYQRNIQFLEDYLGTRIPTGCQAHQAVVAHVGTAPGISFKPFVETTASAISRDDVYAMIACGNVHVDLSSAPMSEPSRVRVFTNEQAARFSVPLAAVENAAKAGPSVVSTPNESQRSSEIWKRLARVGERELQTANERLRHVTGFLTGGAPPENNSSRAHSSTLARSIPSSGERTGQRLSRIAACPRGNATPKLPEETRDLMNELYHGLREPKTENPVCQLDCTQAGVRTARHTRTEPQDVLPGSALATRI